VDRGILPDVTAEATTYDGAPAVSVLIQTPDIEFTIWIPGAELPRLAAVRDARWLPRRSVALGYVARTRTWWSVDPDAQTLVVVVGDDDEAWDLCATLPLRTLDTILAAVSELQGQAHGV
jgi:hypothetical protein